MKCFRCNMKRVKHCGDPFNIIHRHITNYDDYHICNPCNMVICQISGKFCEGKYVTTENLIHNGLTKYNKKYNSYTFYSQKDNDIIQLLKPCVKCEKYHKNN